MIKKSIYDQCINILLNYLSMESGSRMLKKPFTAYELTLYRNLKPTEINNSQTNTNTKTILYF